MPLDPFTGRYMPYDDPVPEVSPGAIGALLDAQPGFIQGALMQGARGSSTMMYGGFGAAKTGISGFTPGDVTDMYNRASRVGEAKDFTFLGRALGGQNPILKPFLRNISPKGILSGQYEDLSVFAPLSQGRYTPAGFTANMMNMAASKSKKVRKAFGIQDGTENPFSAGLFSSLQATSRTDALEKKLVKAIRKGDKRTIGNISEKLGRIDRSTEALLRMNNPGMLAQTYTHTAQAGIPSLGRMNPTPTPSMYSTAESARLTPGGVGQVGIRGNLMVSGLASPTMQRFGGYFRGAGGYGASTGYTGLSGAAKVGALKADKAFLAAAKAAGFDQATRKAMLLGEQKIGIKAGTQIAMSGKVGAKVMAARGVQAAAKFAGPIGWVMLAYDVGKLAGSGVASGINLAKDAAKSFQGSIYKPAFGMGYRDNEVAATSRARGVMAIQNSRLNARSVLGSEGAMMAAHFG